MIKMFVSIDLGPNVFMLFQNMLLFIFMLNNTVKCAFYMRKFHNHEYKKHMKRFFVQAFGWFISIGLLFIVNYIFTLFLSCEISRG